MEGQGLRVRCEALADWRQCDLCAILAMARPRLNMRRPTKAKPVLSASRELPDAVANTMHRIVISAWATCWSWRETDGCDNRRVE